MADKPVGWDARYAAEWYLFGTEPAAFVAREAERLPAGSEVLCVADGEGRNSVYLAGLGHDVTAFDPSAVALEKARALANARDVTVAVRQAGVEDWDWSRKFDVVVGVFIQFAPPAMRAELFAGMARAVRPGGLLLLHGYAPRQVDYGTGGPPDAQNMYTEALLREAFKEFEILYLADYDADIEEGAGHSGRSALVDLVARKPAD